MYEKGGETNESQEDIHPSAGRESEYQNKDYSNMMTRKKIGFDRQNIKGGWNETELILRPVHTVFLWDEIKSVSFIACHVCVFFFLSFPEKISPQND